MSPEQANGQAERIGPRTDVFGLGAVLYEMLTGRPPYKGKDSSAVWDSARLGNVTPPRQVNPRTPRSLDRLCRRALAADPQQRLSSATQFERELRAYLRRPLLAAAGLAALAVVIALVLATQFLPPRSPAHGGMIGAPEIRPAPSPEKQPPPGWQAFHSDKGGYSVWFPGTPTEKDTGVATKRGQRDMNQVKVVDSMSGLTFMVSVTDFSDVVFPDAEKALDGARDGAIQKAKAELLSEESIKLGTHPGREIRFGVPAVKGVVLVMRIYLVGQRNYQLMVAGPEQAANGPSAKTFLQSFRLKREF
jgi:hypothetical protein